MHRWSQFQCLLFQGGSRGAFAVRWDGSDGRGDKWEDAEMGRWKRHSISLRQPGIRTEWVSRVGQSDFFFFFKFIIHTLSFITVSNNNYAPKVLFASIRQLPALSLQRRWTARGLPAIDCNILVPASRLEQSSVLLYVHRDHTGNPGRSPRFSHSSDLSLSLSLSVCLSVCLSLQCCFTSTETVQGTQDGHLDFHTALISLCLTVSVCLCLSLTPVLLYVHRDRTDYCCYSVRDGSPGRPAQLSCSSWSLLAVLLEPAFCIIENYP